MDTIINYSIPVMLAVVAVTATYILIEIQLDRRKERRL